MEIVERLEIVKEYPPNYQEILKYLKPDKGTVFCWGGKIFNPNGVEIPEDIEFHETVHSRQQGGKPELWWLKYLMDKEFRKHQEVEAFAKQVNLVGEHMNRKAKDDCLTESALNLSSEIYGLGLKYHEAETLIRRKMKEIANI